MTTLHSMLFVSKALGLIPAANTTSKAAATQEKLHSTSIKEGTKG
ncbi:hypothetical protein [Pseudomonas sp. DG56-2]|nr:hypothetical protein [Pseudomonas sp. DG56-2]